MALARTALLLAAGTAAALTLTGTPAQAAAAEHCALNADTGRTACAADDATAQRLVTPDGTSASVVIARFYDGTGYTGATLTWTQSRACTTTYDNEWQYSDLRALGWNDRVSSVKTYDHCDVKLYRDINFGGGASVWIDHASDLGTIGSGWNNRASSVKFS